LLCPNWFRFDVKNSAYDTKAGTRVVPAAAFVEGFREAVKLAAKAAGLRCAYEWNEGGLAGVVSLPQDVAKLFGFYCHLGGFRLGRLWH